MVEMTVGSRFWYKDKLCEVVKGGYCYNGCVFKNSNKCNKINCESYERHDRNDVCFIEVKE